MLQNEGFSIGFLVNGFTMVEENFEFQGFEMLQNEGFLIGFLVIGFAMVEENFEFQSFEMLQNKIAVHVE